jgi:signal transduction histidine kinase
MRSHPDRWRSDGAPSGPLYQLGVLARVNLFAVPSSTLLLFVLSSDNSGRNLVRILTIAFVVANCNFAFLDTFYFTVWRRWRRGGVFALAVLCVAAALCGVVAAVAARAILPLLPSALPMVPFSRLLATNVLLSVLFGVAFFRVEDFRQAQHRALARLTNSEEKQKDLEGARDRAEINSLQSLIKPHFVFNTLNAIVALIHEDPPKAEETTLRLARLMRYLLEVSDGEMMSIESELGVVEAYLEIEKVRMGSRLRYALDVEPGLAGIPVPGLVLQPLVENAVKHGVQQRPEGGYVRVRVAREDDKCRVEVVDNGPGFSTHHGAGQATRLVRSRLEFLYHDQHDFQLERDATAGETIVVLRFPLMVPGPARAPAPVRPVATDLLSRRGA